MNWHEKFVAVGMVLLMVGSFMAAVGFVMMNRRFPE